MAKRGVLADRSVLLILVSAAGVALLSTAAIDAIYNNDRAVRLARLDQVNKDVQALHAKVFASSAVSSAARKEIEELTRTVQSFIATVEQSGTKKLDLQLEQLRNRLEVAETRLLDTERLWDALEIDTERALAIPVLRTSLRGLRETVDDRRSESAARDAQLRVDIDARLERVWSLLFVFVPTILAFFVSTLLVPDQARSVSRLAPK